MACSWLLQSGWCGSHDNIVDQRSLEEHGGIPTATATAAVSVVDTSVVAGEAEAEDVCIYCCY